VVLNAPVVAAVHDRFIIRQASPASTVAGGEILALSESTEKPRRRQALEQAREYESFLGGANPSSPGGISRRVEYFLRAGGGREISASEASKGTLLPEGTVSRALAGLAEHGAARALGPDLFVHADSFARLLGEIKAKLEGTASGAGALTLSMGDLQKGYGISTRLWKALEEELRREGLIARQGSTLILSGAAESLGEVDRGILERVLALYEETGFSSPRPEEVPALIGAPEKAVARLMGYLCGRRLLVRLSDAVVLSRTAFLKAQDLAVNLIRERGELDSADFKYSIHSSRKYALAILDYLDSLRVTIRSGNFRKLSPDYERRMLK
jgi:selenocysteine-specific elongation factor